MRAESGGGISSQRRQSYENYITARETHTSIMRDTIQFTRSLHLFVTTDVQRVKARKQANIARTGAALIAAGNIGCLTQLGDGAMPAVHTVELLDWMAGGPEPAAVGRARAAA